MYLDVEDFDMPLEIYVCFDNWEASWVSLPLPLLIGWNRKTILGLLISYIGQSERVKPLEDFFAKKLTSF